MTGMSPRCHFYERINDLGFTELESAAEPGLYLGKFSQEDGGEPLFWEGMTQESLRFPRLL